MMEKCVLVVNEPEAKEVCCADHLCSRTESGNEGGIQPMRLLRKYHYQEEDYGFLLIDACNNFNEENQTDMLWELQFKCIIGARFTFKCCRHWATLVIHDVGGTGHLIHRKEGVTQGEPLSMIA